MKTRNIIMRSVLCVLLICVTIFLAGCPAASFYDYNSVKNGDYFKADLLGFMKNGYGIDFSEENTPTVSISYNSDEGALKTAIFTLDGYDAVKKIGFKIVTSNDKDKLEKERNNGNPDVPDLNDYASIKAAAIQYEYPVIFLRVYDYQNELEDKSISNNQTKFYDELDALLNTQRMIQWFKD